MFNIKTGLILEGGAMRGIFTVGILDVLMENKIKFDGIIGVSAGAGFGCNYKSNQPGRAIRYNTKYCNDKRYCGYSSLFKTGDIYGAKFCYHEIPQKLDMFDFKAFCENPMEFYVVCTDVITGKPIYKKCDMDFDGCLEWIRASASMPLVSHIVEIDGLKMLDGGISDSIPIKYFESIGYDKNVVILTQPRGYIKQKNKLVPMAKIMLKKYPNVVAAMAKRHEIYNDTLLYIKQREKSGDILVIRPDEPLPIGHIEHKSENLMAVYNIGRKTGEKYLEKVKEFTQQ